jgi:PIN domain nuclease of toxin-antitoxin system
MPTTLDSSAMLALVQSEPGAAVVDAALTLAGNICYAHEVNLCEVFYQQARRMGEDVAQESLRYLLEDTGVVPFANPDREFLWEVGRLRARVTSERLAASLADCFCIATARHLGCAVITSDRAEFEPVAALGLCQVTFIR